MSAEGVCGLRGQAFDLTLLVLVLLALPALWIGVVAAQLNRSGSWTVPVPEEQGDRSQDCQEQASRANCARCRASCDRCQAEHHADQQQETADDEGEPCGGVIPEIGIGAVGFVRGGAMVIPSVEDQPADTDRFGGNSDSQSRQRT